MGKRQAASPLPLTSAQQQGWSTCTESAQATSSELITSLSSKLACKPVSDLEKKSWGSLVRAINNQGAVVVTDHDQPVAVVLSVENYETLARLAQREQAHIARKIAELNERVDQRLASLKKPDARRALDALMDEPVLLGAERRTDSS